MTALIVLVCAVSAMWVIRAVREARASVDVPGLSPFQLLIAAGRLPGFVNTMYHRAVMSADRSLQRDAANLTVPIDVRVENSHVALAASPRSSDAIRRQLCTVMLTPTPSRVEFWGPVRIHATFRLLASPHLAPRDAAGLLGIFDDLMSTYPTSHGLSTVDLISAAKARHDEAIREGMRYLGVQAQNPSSGMDERVRTHVILSAAAA